MTTIQGEIVGTFPDEDDDGLHTIFTFESGGPRPPRHTILHWAASYGSMALVEKMLEKAKPIWWEYVDFRHSLSRHGAVHLAAIAGRLDVLRVLAENGCAMNQISGYKCVARRPLFDVLNHIKPGIVGPITGNFVLTTPDEPFALNSLGFALLNGHEECARFLADYHVEQENTDPPHENPHGHDITSGIHLNANIFRQRREIGGTDWFGQYVFSDTVVPPLVFAAFFGMIDIAKTLIQKGAAVDVACNSVAYSTPLMWAAGREGNSAMISFLLERGADIEERDNHRRTVLDWALHFDAPQNAYMLLQRGANPHIRGRSGFPPLQRCMLDDRFLDCTQFMVRNSFIVGQEEYLVEILRVVLQSTEGKNIQTLRYFIENDIGLESVGDVGLDADMLFQAIQLNDVVSDLSMDVVLASDADTQHRTTVLHNAISPHVPYDLFKLLLEKRKCDINTKDKQGRTAASLILCHPSWDRDKADLLFRYGADPSACSSEEDRIVMQAIKDGMSRGDIQNLLDEFDAPRVARYKAMGEGNSKMGQLAIFRSLGVDEAAANELFRDGVARSQLIVNYVLGMPIGLIHSYGDEARRALLGPYGDISIYEGPIREAYRERPRTVQYR